MGTGKYAYGYEAVPKAMTAGTMPYNEYLDAENHGVPKTLPWAVDARGFHGTKFAMDRINTQYDNMMKDGVNPNGPAVPKFSSMWEYLDAENHGVPKTLPWAVDARGFHGTKFAMDRINTQYDNMMKDGVNPNGPAVPKFSSMWEKTLAYHKGLYVPEAHQEAKSADDIRIAVSEFSDRVQQVKPTDACKYLEIEEFRCLQAQQVELDVNGASKRCLKWFDQLQQCKWDQHKFNNGISFIEGPELHRRKAYYFYPNFKVA